MAYVYVTGVTNTPDTMTEEIQIKQILHWAGFTTAAQKAAIYDDSIQEYGDLLNMSESDVTDLAKDYSSRSAASRINFGLRRIKKLKSIIHWTKDHRRISSTPNVEGMNGTAFHIELLRASQRAQICKQLHDDADNKAKASSPGPLESEDTWIEWETKFNNYLSTIPGVDGVPLSYVIRVKETPDPNATFTSFVEETVAKAPLRGTYFEADRDTVHQAIVSFTAGQNSENWIKKVTRFRDGRRSMQALKDHFSGEGNVTRRIAEAERIRDTLQYKNERNLTFETYITKCEKMYNIFENHGETMEEDAKIRFLFKNIHHSGLEADIAALKASITTNPTGTITYSTVCNHLSTAVSQLPEFIAKGRNISAIDRDEASSLSCYKDDGVTLILDEYLPDWMSYPADTKKKILSERARLGIKLGRGGKGNSNSPNNSVVTKLKKANEKFKRKIKALKKLNPSNEDNDEEEDEISGDESQDAGDQFGGKNSKKKKKKGN